MDCRKARLEAERLIRRLIGQEMMVVVEKEQSEWIWDMFWNGGLQAC